MLPNEKDKQRLNTDTMTTEQRESKSAQWRTDNLSKNAVLSGVSDRLFLETYEGEYNDLPDCKNGCGKMLPESNGGFQQWHECPKCGECDD